MTTSENHFEVRESQLQELLEEVFKAGVIVSVGFRGYTDGERSYRSAGFQFTCERIRQLKQKPAISR